MYPEANGQPKTGQLKSLQDNVVCSLRRVLYMSHTYYFRHAEDLPTTESLAASFTGLPHGSGMLHLPVLRWRLNRLRTP